VYTNKYYDLDYDPVKNQINWKVKGFWQSVDIVPSMEADWESTLGRARKPGFNILADLTTMKSPPQDVKELHAKVQGRIIEAGVYKLAVVIDSPLTNLSVTSIGKKSGMNQLTTNFSDEKSAQAWLDEA
jgi:hypothetical protein